MIILKEDERTALADDDLYLLQYLQEYKRLLLVDEFYDRYARLIAVQRSGADWLQETRSRKANVTQTLFSLKLSREKCHVVENICREKYTRAGRGGKEGRKKTQGRER